MKEKDLRKYHRIMGVVLAVFIVVQAGTGLYFSFEKLLGNHEDSGHDHASSSFSMIAQAHANGNDSMAHEEDETSDIMDILHHGGGMPGDIYRLLLAVGIIGQAGGGLLLFKHHLERQSKKN